MENEKCGSIGSERETAAESAQSGIDKTKQALAEKLRQVAYSVGEKATDPGTPAAISCYEKLAADWLHVSAEQVEQFDILEAQERLRDTIRKNPGSSLMIAAAAGFLAGAFIRSR